MAINIPAAIYDRIYEAAATHQVNPLVVAAVVEVERASLTGEIVGDQGHSFGPMQLHLQGAGSGQSIHALLDFQFNLNLGTAYLKRWLHAYPANLALAFTAYNWPAKAAQGEVSRYGQIVLQRLTQLQAEGIERDPPDAPTTPSLLELIDTVWGCLDQAAAHRTRKKRIQAVQVGHDHLSLLRQRLGL